MQPAEGYGTLPMDLHMPPQGYHPYYSVLEMRKEKSRDAARSRRGKENYEFYELAKLLPLPAAITSQLDKASIIRLSISYLKLMDFSSHGDPPWGRDAALKSIKSGHIRSRSMGMSMGLELFEQHQGTHILQSLDGFAFALNADGRFLYVSETVSIYLGLSQVEMTGSSVFDYIHHQDHAELAEQLGINLSQASTSPGSTGSDDGSSNAGGPSTPTDLDRPAPVMTVTGNSLYKGLDRSFCIRMKSTLTKRGCHFKSSGYRVVLVLSHHRPQYSFSHNRKNPPVILGMVALAIALPPPSMNEVRLENDMFVTRLTFDFRIAHCEPRISELLDYTAEEMTGKNMYLLCHGQDVQKLRQCHIDLIHKGQVMSSYYRFMNKNGGYTWMQTCATIICNTKTSEEQSIICVNYVLSATEYENYIMDCSQMRHTNNLKPDDPSNSEKDDSVDKEGRDTATPDDTEPTASSPKSSHGDNSMGSDSLESNHLTQLGSSNKLPSQLLGSASQKVSLSENSSLSFLEEKQMQNDSISYEDKLSSNEISPEDNYQKERSRKRRLQELSSSSDADSKSAKAKPSSLETAAVDSGVYLVDASSNLSENSERLGASSKDESSSPISLTGSQSNENNKEVSRPWRCSPSHVYSEIGNSSAVPMKDLEDAINRHLPNTSHNNSSQDMLQKGFYAQHSQQSQRSAIQWIGAPQPTLPASTFLRQLYVNRESVIRSGAHPSRPSYYGDVQGTLPTPPASSNESYAPKMGAESYGVIPGYSASSGGTFMDTCSAMTPPASVSPRDKFHSTMADASAFSEATIPHLRHYVTDPPIQHLPLKPQVFVHPGTIDPAAYSHSQQPLSPEQQQLYAHHGFHLYHGKTAHHPVNGTSWYPQPNS